MKKNLTKEQFKIKKAIAIAELVIQSYEIMVKMIKNYSISDEILLRGLLSQIEIIKNASFDSFINTNQNDCITTKINN